MRSSIRILRRLRQTPTSLVLTLGLTLALVACERRVAVEVRRGAAVVGRCTVEHGWRLDGIRIDRRHGALGPCIHAGRRRRRPYDVSKMDFKSPPAAISSERHTGPFAAGSALSMDAALKPLDPAPVKEVRLDTTHKIIEIAPGVKFSAWTFGDQVPGPTIRARVGDRISSR